MAAFTAGTMVGRTFNQCQWSGNVGNKKMTIISAEIGVWIPAARPKPPETIKKVATKPKKEAPVGNRMLAVCTGLGQRRTLLSPLINMRQPRTTLSAASPIIMRVECSNDFSSGGILPQYRSPHRSASILDPFKRPHRTARHFQSPISPEAGQNLSDSALLWVVSNKKFL